MEGEGNHGAVDEHLGPLGGKEAGAVVPGALHAEDEEGGEDEDQASEGGVDDIDGPVDEEERPRAEELGGHDHAVDGDQAMVGRAVWVACVGRARGCGCVWGVSVGRVIERNAGV